MIARKSDVIRDLVARAAPAIRQHAAQMEAERSMPLELHNALREAGLFRLYVPQEFGGAGYTLPEGLQVVEAVSKIDGSAGWTVALSFAAGYFTGGLDEHVAREVLGDGSNLVVGSGKPVKAVATDGGFRVFGRAPFVSGIRNADWVCPPAAVFDGETPRPGPGGMPEMIGFFMPRSEVQVIDCWNVTGLCGTGTNDVAFDGQFVPGERTAPGNPITGFMPRREGTLLRMPFMTLVPVVQAPPVMLGIAQHAMAEFRALAASKTNPFTGAALRDRQLVQAQVGRAEASIRAARGLFFASVEEAWATVDRGGGLDAEAKASVRLACNFVAESCMEAVDSLARMAATSAIASGSEFERAWRDIHAAGAHLQVQDVNWETAGRVWLGLEPGSFVF
jgi:alkylation response protein AidB-like acyl-CoA dehydrogenase